MLVLRLFGGLSLDQDGSPLEGVAAQRSRLAILAVLATVGDRGISRDRLLAMFWPESDAERARGSLKQALYGVRRAVGGRELTLGTTDLRLNPDVVSCDLTEFRVAALGARPEDWARAAALYVAPLLDGVYVKGAPEFEEWAERERVRAADMNRSLLERLSRAADARGDLSAAVTWWRALANTEPTNGRFAQGLMAALVANGERAAAIRHGEIHSTLATIATGGEPDLQVHTVITPAAPDLPEEPAVSAGLASSSGAVTPVTVTTHEAVHHRAHLFGIGVAGLALVAAAAVWAYAHKQVPARTGSVVVVAPFDSPAKDSSLNDIARVATQWVSDGVTRAGIATIDPQLVVGIPRRASANGNAGNGTYLPDDLIERIGVTLVVTGSVSRRNDSLEFRARITEWRTKRVISSVETIHAPASNPAAGLSELTDRLQGALASFADPRVSALQDVAAPPPRFAAYLDYVEGQDVFVGRRGTSSDYKGSIPYFLNAAQRDTTFDLPLIWLVFAYNNASRSGYPSLASASDSMVDILERRRHRLSPLSRYALDYFLAYRANDLERQYRAVVAASEIAPGSNWTYLRGMLGNESGHRDDAIRAFQQLDVDDSWSSSWQEYWSAYTKALRRAGRLDAELAVARNAVARANNLGVLVVLFSALGSRGDSEGVERLADSLEASVPETAGMTRFGVYLGVAAQMASVSGKEKAARAIAERCIRWNHKHAPDPLHPTGPLEHSSYQHFFTECLVVDGRLDDAQHLAMQAAKDSDAYGDLAAIRLVLLAAVRGDSASMHGYVREAYARPRLAATSSYGRVGLDASMAALSGDAPKTAAILSRLPKGVAASLLEELIDIPQRIRHSREVQRAIAGR